jgi:glutathione peroxidase-family protein
VTSGGTSVSRRSPLHTLLACSDAPNTGAKFIIDKNGNVVDRNGDSPMASEAKIKSLL